jgi:hypothetical protein
MRSFERKGYDSSPKLDIREGMRHLSIVAFIALSIVDCFAQVRSNSHDMAQQNCALASQREVARRHGLRIGSDTSSKIYANPRWAAEADNLFDACVKR